MNEVGGIAIICDAAGNIMQVLHDKLNLSAVLQIGRPFARLAASGSLAKALAFLAEIHSQGAVFDWEIAIKGPATISSLHFSGCMVEEALFIVGGENSHLTQRLYEEMMGISNDQTSALRAVLKENSRLKREDHLYDEVSRLNNELVAMQRELVKKTFELERLNQEKNRFLGMVAHDLRNPLQVILNYSELLLESPHATLTPKQAKFLTVIQTSSEFMVNLIANLLDVAQIEAGKLRLEIQPMNLVKIVQHSVALHRLLADKKQVEITLAVDPLPIVWLDGPKIEQILNNLLSNAIKFSFPGGRVDVRLQQVGENCCLEVQDYGVGMSAEDQSNLFKPFQRGQGGTAGERSVGLGLTIVKRIVEGHNGKIWLKSQLEQGTTFFVTLPIRPPQKVAETEST